MKKVFQTGLFRIGTVLTIASTISATAFPTVAPTPNAGQTIIIGLGESTRLEAYHSGKLHISDGSIVRTRRAGNAMIFTGKKTGRAKLRYADSKKEFFEKTLYVTERKTAATAKLFLATLQKMRGLHLLASQLPEIVVGGELLRVNDWLSLVQIARTHQTPWRFSAVALLPPVREVLKNKIKSEIQHLPWASEVLKIGDDGLQIVTARTAGKTSAKDLKQLSLLGIEVVHSESINALEPMIRTHVIIAEVKRSAMQKLGISWPTSIGLEPTAQVFNLATLQASLNAAEETGEGRVLALPNLLCRSGGEAKFFAGGEIPIKVSNFRTSSVEWKKYGITLEVKPRADRLRRMSFQLITEISSLDDSVKTDSGIPGLMENRIETQFNLNGVQTIALSGLVKKEEGKTLSGFGVLNSIPILGKLFESQDFRQGISELLIFLTPEVIFPEQESPRSESLW